MDTDKPREQQDISVLANRLSLISRYNQSVGEPGPAAQQVQHEFITGMPPVSG